MLLQLTLFFSVQSSVAILWTDQKRNRSWWLLLLWPQQMFSIRKHKCQRSAVQESDFSSIHNYFVFFFFLVYGLFSFCWCFCFRVFLRAPDFICISSENWLCYHFFYGGADPKTYKPMRGWRGWEGASEGKTTNVTRQRKTENFR